MNEEVIKEDLLKIMLINHKVLKPYENENLNPLTMLQFRTLCVLDGEGRGLSLNRLAHIQKITKQQQSFILKGLVDEQYVHREIDQNDRRSTLFYITPKGEDFLKCHLSYVVEGMLERMNTLNEERLEKAYEAIHYISEILGEIV